MKPAEMIYAAMKVSEMTERIAQKEMRENALRRKAERVERRKQQEENNEALRKMINRK